MKIFKQILTVFPSHFRNAMMLQKVLGHSNLIIDIVCNNYYNPKYGAFILALFVWGWWSPPLLLMVYLHVAEK